MALYAVRRDLIFGFFARLAQSGTFLGGLVFGGVFTSRINWAPKVGGQEYHYYLGVYHSC